MATRSGMPARTRVPNRHNVDVRAHHGERAVSRFPQKTDCAGSRREAILSSLINHLRIPGGVPNDEGLSYLEQVEATEGPRWRMVSAGRRACPRRRMADFGIGRLPISTLGLRAHHKSAGDLLNTPINRVVMNEPTR